MLGRLCAVLDQRAGVPVQAGSGGRTGPIGGQSLDELCPPALEQSQTGLRGKVLGEGQAQPEAPGVISSGGLAGG